MKVVFLIIASENFINETDLETQRQTWAYDLPTDFQFISLRGSMGQKYEFKNGTLWVPCLEKYENILKKTVLGIKYVVENYDFDILIRSNVSTYFDYSRLRGELMKKRYSKPFFGGYIDKTKGRYFQNSGILDYISGTGIFLSRSAAEKLSIMDYESYKDVPDDVAISDFLKKTKITRIRMARNNLGSTHIFLPSYYIRTKSSADSELASMRMRLIYSYFNQKTFVGRLRAYRNIFRLELRAFLHHPEPKIRYFQRNRIVMQSFISTKGVQLWKLLTRL